MLDGLAVSPTAIRRNGHVSVSEAVAVPYKLGE
jgi:hypothetical protein